MYMLIVPELQRYEADEHSEDGGAAAGQCRCPK